MIPNNNGLSFLRKHHITVQILWEGHKNLKKISRFVLTLLNNLKTRNFVAFSQYLSFIYPELSERVKQLCLKLDKCNNLARIHLISIWCLLNIIIFYELWYYFLIKTVNERVENCWIDIWYSCIILLIFPDLLPCFLQIYICAVPCSEFETLSSAW